jgi:twinkle protein
MSTKQFITLKGNTKFKGLFGKQAFNPSKKWPIVITEGEWDAVSVWQATGVPAVSIPMGVGSVGILAEELEWLQQWKHIIILFDKDEAGKEATVKAINMLPVGSSYLANLSEKDANDMVVQGKFGELKTALWNSKPYKPESIVTVENILDKIIIKPEYGMSFPWNFLTEGMFGLQPHHLYSIIGFSKVGKTEFIKEIIFHLIEIHKSKIGIFSLEQGTESTIQRLVASFVNKPLHLPSNTWWDEEVIKKKAMEFNEIVYLYQNSSNQHLTLESLLINIRYMYFCFGIKVIIIDNLTALCTNPVIDDKLVSDENFKSHVMKKLFTLTRELPISVLLVDHIYESKLNRQIHIPTSVENKANYMAISANEIDKMINKPGLDWGSGRMPGLGDVNKMVGRMSDYVLGLSRNVISENDYTRRILKVKFLATRLGSEHCGKHMDLIYNYETGRYEECQEITSSLNKI